VSSSSTRCQIKLREIPCQAIICIPAPAAKIISASVEWPDPLPSYFHLCSKVKIQCPTCGELDRAIIGLLTPNVYIYIDCF
jgi:hypothetical protein